jgi:hypothetical protein
MWMWLGATWFVGLTEREKVVVVFVFAGVSSGTSQRCHERGARAIATSVGRWTRNTCDFRSPACEQPCHTANLADSTTALLQGWSDPPGTANQLHPSLLHFTVTRRRMDIHDICPIYDLNNAAETSHMPATCEAQNRPRKAVPIGRYPPIIGRR